MRIICLEGKGPFGMYTLQPLISKNTQVGLWIIGEH